MKKFRHRKAERRSFAAARPFPFTDSKGCVVPFERSRRTERRMNSYVLREATEAEIRLYRLLSRFR